MLSVFAIYLLCCSVLGSNGGYSNLRALKLTEISDPPISNGNFINSGTPSVVTVSFDCAARIYAYQYGQQIQPRHGTFVDLFDSLQLQACNQTRPKPTPRYIPTYKSSSSNKLTAGCTFYIDPVNGKDTNDGSLTSPFLTIMKGITG